MQTPLVERATVPVAVALRPAQPISGLVYQGMTIIVMLWLLTSFWIF